MYDLLIIGGGPAGTAAGVYAARKRIKTMLITQDFGGQSVVSSDIQNFIGIPSLPGIDISKRFKEHLEAYKDDVLGIKEGDVVVRIEKIENGFRATTKEGKSYEARAVLACSGSSRRKLSVPGAEKFDNKGISYCASCDAPLFKNQDIVVIGGGNAGFEAAEQLLVYARSVTLLEYTESFKADPVTVQRVLKNEKMKALTNAEVVEIKGSEFVSGLSYKDRAIGDLHELNVGGIFIEIGAIPNSDMVKGLVKLNAGGEIEVDPKTQRASVEGIWAAGDVSDVLYKQNNISMGDAVKALENIYLWLQEKK